MLEQDSKTCPLPLTLQALDSPENGTEAVKPEHQADRLKQATLAHYGSRWLERMLRMQEGKRVRAPSGAPKVALAHLATDPFGYMETR